jgi:hypothetical protein
MLKPSLPTEAAYSLARWSGRAAFSNVFTGSSCGRIEMTQISDIHEFLDQNSRVSVTVNGRRAQVSVEAAQEDKLRAVLSPLGLVIGPGVTGKGLTESDLAKLGGTLVLLQLGGEGTTAAILALDSKDNNVLKFHPELAELTIGGLNNAGNVRVLDETGSMAVHLNGRSGDIDSSEVTALRLRSLRRWRVGGRHRHGHWPGATPAAVQLLL